MDRQKKPPQHILTTLAYRLTSIRKVILWQATLSGAASSWENPTWLAGQWECWTAICGKCDLWLCPAVSW